MADVQTSLKVFLDTSPRSVHFNNAFFLVKSKISSLGTTLLKCQVIIISELVDMG